MYIHSSLSTLDRKNSPLDRTAHARFIFLSVNMAIISNDEEYDYTNMNYEIATR